MATAYVGLGSNLGNRARALREALRRLRSAGLGIEAVSPVFETEPVGCEGPSFYNAVVRLNTTLPPSELLALLLRTEGEIGPKRAAGPRGPRVIDLDLLLYDDVILSNGALVIPHPRMTLRRFVLEPLSRLAPDLVIPGQQLSVAVLAEKLVLSAPEQGVHPVKGLSIGPKAEV